MATSPVRQLLRAHVARARWRLLLAAACMLGVAATELLAPWPVKLAFDHVLLERPLPAALAGLPGVAGPSRGTALWLLAAGIVAIGLVRGAFAYLQLWLTARIGQETVHALCQRLFSHLQRLPLGFHTRARSGELLTKLVSDTRTLKDMVTDSALALAAELVTVLGMLGVMVWLNWRLTAVVLLTVPAQAAALRYIHREIRAAARRQRENEGRVVARLVETLGAVQLVQAYGREGYETARFATESAQALAEGVHTARVEAAATRSVEAFAGLGTAAVVLVGAFQVLDGRLSPGELLVFTAYVAAMYRPVRRLARLSSRFSRARASAERLVELLSVEPDVRDAPDARPAPPLGGRITFEQVCFGYEAGAEVLRDVSFDLAPGRTAVVLGPSGVGKSTLVNLLLRFYDPASGRILVDGIDIRRYTLASLREQIAVVLQDSVLFGATIAANIGYGRPGATRAEIVAAARAANAHAFITALPQGYDTILGERGATLSGGQRRRIAIARALVRDAAILVLDEPMAGLDAESEAAVRDALTRLVEGKTCLVIAHDLAAAPPADTVLVLHGGRLVAHGRPRELATGSAHYRRLTTRRAAAAAPAGRRDLSSAGRLPVA